MCAHAVQPLIQAATDNPQLAGVALAPVAFEREGAYVSALLDAERIADHVVAVGAIDRIQPRAGVEQFVGRGDERVTDTDGVTVVFLVRFEFEAIAGEHIGARIGPVA
jgi:hypothetical protein